MTFSGPFGVTPVQTAGPFEIHLTVSPVPVIKII